VDTPLEACLRGNELLCRTSRLFDGGIQQSNSKKINCTCTGVLTAHLNRPTHRQHIRPVSDHSRCRTHRAKKLYLIPLAGRTPESGVERKSMPLFVDVMQSYILVSNFYTRTFIYSLLLGSSCWNFVTPFSCEKTRTLGWWWKNFDDMFNRFDTIPACDRQTDVQMYWWHCNTIIPCISVHSCACGRAIKYSCERNSYSYLVRPARFRKKTFYFVAYLLKQ